MIDYYIIEQTLTEYYNFFNGKVNTLKSHRFEFNYGPSPILAGEHNGAIFFYPPKIWDTYKNASPLEWKTKAMIIVIHELSHVDQYIDYDRYRTDKSYSLSIEVANNISTFRWISQNIKGITHVYPEIDLLTIYDLSKDLNLGEDITQHNNVYSIIEAMMDKIMRNYKFSDFDKVYIQLIYPEMSYTIQVKEYNNIIDPERVLNVYHNIYEYDNIRNGIKIVGKDVLVTLIFGNKKTPIDVVYTNVPYYGTSS